MFLADVCIEQEGGVGMEAEWNVALLQPPQYLAKLPLGPNHPGGEVAGDADFELRALG